MSKGYKGGEFEREISKRLSIWWSTSVEAKPRDDLFWRSSQSGGRATVRARKGRSTAGSYGDIAAIDPIGAPLLRFVTLELKRGSSWGTPGDLLDTPPTSAVRPFEAALLQAYSSHQLAGSRGWGIIARRDRREAMLYLDSRLVKLLGSLRGVGRARMHFFVSPHLLSFHVFQLEEFLRLVSPLEIIGQLEQ